MVSFAKYIRGAREKIIAASRKRFPSGLTVARQDYGLVVLSLNISVIYQGVAVIFNEQGQEEEAKENGAGSVPRSQGILDYAETVLAMGARGRRAQDRRPAALGRI